ncbi:hypothetical protein WICMUC_003175 [Wickerhamomyces mucosus]|uniref:Eukaryotic translation initiation factor 3 subunit C n=1 Tax=Wickerhamomyces mucosus TaxID=1378264 RepID=A0A9P8TDE1_9ASCO|nr:hypothetical protein WICMUC_003175 [Wickerhamomyces mucosus]
MSRFFQGGLSDSDYSSSEEELLSSSDEEELNSSEEEQQDDDDLSDDSEFANNDESDSDSDDDDARGPSYFLKKSFVKDESDDESDDDKKVVRSAKDKLLDEIRNAITIIDSSKEINDWVVVLSEFDKLNRFLIRAEQQRIPTPNSYIKSLLGLEETINNVSADSNKKKLNALVSKAFNTVKQRVKKSIREQSKLVEAFKSNPDAFEKDDGSSLETPTSIPSIPAVEDGFVTVGKSGKSITGGTIFKTLRSIIESRGKKNVDVREQIKQLESAVEDSLTPYQSIVLYLMLIPLRFDVTSANTNLSNEEWIKTAKDINTLFEILEKNRSTYAVLESAEPSDDIEIEPTPNKNGVREILGSVVSFVERLDDEFSRSLQVIDPHTTEYVDRLRDEQLIYSTILRAQLYSESFTPESDIALPSSDPLARIIARRIEHIYFKQTSLIVLSEKQAWESLSSINQKSYVANFSDSKDYTDSLLDNLSSVLYKQSNGIYRKRAMLSHIYYYAFNNKYYKARDMFLMSHLQSTIHTSEPSLQILFNRALVQLGLCAFRNGLIEDAHQNLFEITTSQKTKELLGQNFQRYSQQNTVVDRQRQLPFHTHINLELLEAVYLTSALLIEIPQLAARGAQDESKQQKQGKTFRKYLEGYEKHYFQGPPESIKDHILHAAKALQSGDWKKSAALLTSIKVWDLYQESDKLKELIKEKLQVEGLRTYLFQFKAFYSKLSIKKLTQIFELPESKVSAVVSKMIFNEELAAGLDQISNTIIFTKGVELTKLQELALALADKSVSLSERNERLAGAQQQQNNSNNYNSGNNSQRQNRQNKNSNFKFAPVTGALSSAPGSISGALNGMDKTKRRTTRA